jgi:hypothetical protein
MSDTLLKVTMVLAYGPFLLMAALYLAGLLLRAGGRPELLKTLVERTNVPQPVVREETDENQ